LTDLSEDKTPDSKAESKPDEAKSAKTTGTDSALPSVSRPIQPTRESVNPYAFALGTASIVILTKVASFLTPYKLYFTFSSFIYGESKIFRWESLTIKLAIPCVVGFCLYFLPFHWMRITSGSRISYRVLFRYLSRQSELSAKMSGFFSSLLMAWPFIVYWDIMMRPDKLDLKLPFWLFICYILYHTLILLAWGWFLQNYCLKRVCHEPRLPGYQGEFRGLRVYARPLWGS
jgi:hypothetical protein